MNLNIYQFKIDCFRLQMNRFEPHGNHEPKNLQKCTKIKRKESKQNTKENWQTNMKEIMRRSEKNYKNNKKINKMA